jgi:hypothetical protein
LATPLLRGKRQAFGVIGLLRRLDFGLDRGQRSASFRRGVVRGEDRIGQFGKLALARQHTVQLAVRREKADRLRGDQMSVGA